MQGDAMMANTMPSINAMSHLVVFEYVVSSSVVDIVFYAYENMAEVFWVEDPSVLLSSLKLIPRSSDSIEETFNIYTRDIILIGAGLYLVGEKHWLVIMLAALIVVICIYYAQRDTNTVETYEPPEEVTYITAPAHTKRKVYSKKDLSKTVYDLQLDKNDRRYRKREDDDGMHSFQLF
jgi:hypothetical protein